MASGINISRRSTNRPSLPAAYIAYRDRVLADGGNIYSADQTVAAYNVLAAQGLSSALRQWLDPRFGRKTTFNVTVLMNQLYNLGAATEDATADNVRAPELVTSDANLHSPVLRNNNSGMLAGTVQALAASDNYTWGMKYYLPSGGTVGIMFGNRYGSTPLQQWWSVIPASFTWVDLSNGGGIVTYNYTTAMPSLAWDWVWVVKSGSTYTFYNSEGTVFGTKVINAPMGVLPTALGCGPQYESGYPNLRYQGVVRFAAALTQTQRTAIQNI
jgi:hypothetical protein